MQKDKDALVGIEKSWIDLALVGDDVLNEIDIVELDIVDRFLPKIIQPCRFELMGRADRVYDLTTMLEKKKPLTVATSFPKALAKFAATNELALPIEIVNCGGTELYPAKGFTDLAFDIVQSGSTKTANNLVSVLYGDTVELNVVRGIGTRVRSMRDDLLRADQTMASRLRNPTDSYASRVVADANLSRKKVSEEAGEFIVASVNGTKAELVGEGADLIQAVRYVLVRTGLTVTEVIEEDIRRNQK
ncbi:MAG: phosphoribosyl-ATP diphosphatase [Candidatus Saccharibacteria bacterium]|nr:phosphoribosyl-ATP diphosphatase [Candidatus Saccharibacteria bacterium]